MKREYDSLSRYYARSRLLRAGVSLIPFAGAAIHELLMPQEPIIDSELSSTNFLNDVTDELKEIDLHLMAMVRSMEHSGVSRFVDSVYANHCKSSLEKLPDDLKCFFTDIHASESLYEKPPTPDLVIRCGALTDEGRLGSISFERERDTLIVVEDCELLWPCNCETWNALEKLNLDGGERQSCPIHGHPNGAEVSEVFKNGLVKIIYGNVQIFWRQSPYIWPPSVDAFALLEDVLSWYGNDQQPRSVLDLGSGAGFLGIALANKWKSTTELIMSEWLFTPLIYSAINCARNLDDNRVLRRFFLGLNFRWINAGSDQRKQSKYDLIICNPPYLPFTGEILKEQLSSTVVGTDLLQHIICSGLNYSDKVVLSFSNVAKTELAEVLKYSSVDLQQIGPSREVAFRLSSELSKPIYISRLLDSGNLKLDLHSQFPLRHEIASYCLKGT